MAKSKRKKESFRFRYNKFKHHEGVQCFYDDMNKKYFKHQLPLVFVGFYYDRDDSYGATLRLHGAKYCSHIMLNPKFKEWVKATKITLLHEMCHVKLHNKGGHGPKFKKELRRLILAGAFDDLL